MSDGDWNFALIRRGGNAPIGKRPSTMLAEAVRPAAYGMSCFLLDPKTLKRRTKHAVFVPRDTLLKTWLNRPSQQQIKEAKAAVPITTE